jgi:hypothetical protein
VRTSKNGFLMLLLVLGMFPSAMAKTKVGKVTLGGVKIVGTTSISGASTVVSSASINSRVQPLPDLVGARRASVPKEMASTANALAAALSVPAPKPNTVKSGGNSFGFPGLTTVDTANANFGFVLTPPDQGLCVGNGYLLEAINLALAVYDKTGTQVAAPVSLDSFFETSGFFTDFLSDPRCYYDIPTQRGSFPSPTCSTSSRVAATSILL